MMNPWAILGIVVALLASHAGMFHAGGEVRDAYWRTQIDRANAEKTKEIKTVNTQIVVKDQADLDRIASLETQIKERENDLEAVRNSTPLPLDCNSCRVPARIVDGVRTGAAASSDRQAPTARTSATRFVGRTFSRPVSAVKP
jgi:hypothetical protein